MVLLIVAVCWCRGNRYIPSKCTFFWILHRNRAQNMIQCHDNNIWKKMCIKNIYIIVLRHIFYTTYKGKNQAKKYMWDLHHKLVLFLQSRNCFCYIPDNEIEGGILGWTTSYKYWGNSRIQRILTYISFKLHTNHSTINNKNISGMVCSFDSGKVHTRVGLCYCLQNEIEGWTVVLGVSR